MFIYLIFSPQVQISMKVKCPDNKLQYAETKKEN